MKINRNPTRSVAIGSISIGSDHPIAVQSMTATHTQDVAATVAQVNDLHGAGADVVRLSIGLEDVDDIIADLDQALASV